MALDSLDPGGGWNTSYNNADEADPYAQAKDTTDTFDAPSYDYGTQANVSASAPTSAGAGGTMPKDPAAATASQQASYTTGQAGTAQTQQQSAVANDQQARQIANDLQAAGHETSWQGNQLMVDGRPYDVPGSAQAAPNMQGITDPAVTQGAQAASADSASIGAGIPWNPGEDHPSYNPPGYVWDGKTASFQPVAAQSTTSGGTPAYSGAPTDRNAIKAWIGQLASMPGADPSLANDPDYWVGRIVDNGGLTGANTDYWMKAGVGSTAFFNNPNREAGGGVPAGGATPGPSAADTFQQPALGASPGVPASPNIPTITDPNANWNLDTSHPTVTDPNAGWNPSFQTPNVTAPTIGPRVDPTAPWGAEGPTSYKGETLDTSDIPSFTPESILAAEKGTGAATGLDTLVTNLENSQGPLDQKTIDTIKGQQKDTLAEQASFQDQNLKGMGGAMGIGDSPWLAAQRAQGMFSRDQSIAASGAAIDVDAAKTNYAARQANAGIGTAYDNAKTAQYMQAVDAGLQRATVTGNREALQASIDQAAAASGQSAQKISADWLQHNVDADTAKELAAAGIKFNYDSLTSANQNHLNDLMMAVQQLKASTSLQTQTANLDATFKAQGLNLSAQQLKSASALQTQTANLTATLQKYGIDVNAALQMSAQQLQKYGIDTATQLQLANLKQQQDEFFAGLGQADRQFGANYGLNFSKMQHDFSNDDWYHSYMDTSNL